MFNIRVFYILGLSLCLSVNIAQAANEDQAILQNDDVNWNAPHDAHDKQMLKEAEEADLRVKNEMGQMPGEEPMQSAEDIQNLQMLNEQNTPQKKTTQPQNITPAQTIQKQATVQEPPKRKPNTFEIAPETSYISYRESVEGATFVKEKGAMNGLNANYTLHLPEGESLYSQILSFSRFEGRFSYGKIEYMGSNDFKGIDDYMAEVRTLFGKDYHIKKISTTLTPYVGFGYRSLFDSFYEDKPGGYARWIQYLYIPTGAEVTTEMKNGWSISVKGEYDFFAYGYVTSYLGKMGLGDVSNPQKHGYGLKGSLKVVKRFKYFNLFLEPFVRYWHIKDSNFEWSTPFYIGSTRFHIGGTEPDNTSTEIGGRVGIEF
ncbi:MAG: hypothetical protein HQL14_02170 [Candidatus Omnitrophica bacterium]|nr:hypothetical protein [Candidatus Omnitrophota bacterium]